jgi:tetratricopeptide (TPR) repeat protein
MSEITDPRDVCGQKAEHPLAGHRVAFTGRLIDLPRRDAFRLVREAGGEPVGTVTGRTSLLVIGMEGWPILKEGAISRKLEQAEILQERGHSIQINSEFEFLERIGIRSGRTGPVLGTCSMIQACNLLCLPPEKLRRCEQFGLVRSEDGVFDFLDLVSLRTIAGLLQDGLTPEAIARSLARLARIVPEINRPLAQMRIIVDQGGKLMAELDGIRMDPRGQMILDLEGRVPREAAPSVPLEKRKGRTEDPETWFDYAQSRARNSDPAAAEAAYRRALEIDPDFAEAWYNLGNLHLERGDSATAENHFRRALSLDPAFAAAWYNLGLIQAEQERLSEASQSLRRALAAFPAYADAHFNLALCLEKLDRPWEAEPHWRKYLLLAPADEWATIARTHLDRFC